MKKMFAALIVLMALTIVPAYASMTIGKSYIDQRDYISDDGTIRYIAAEKTLILTGANISVDYYCIATTDGEIEKIELIGENTLYAYGSSYGVNLTGDLRIYGSGSLKITSDFTALWVDGSLTIDGATVECYTTANAVPTAIKIYDGNLSLVNGAGLYAKNGQSNVWKSPVIEMKDSYGISVLGGSTLTVEAPCDYLKNNNKQGRAIGADYIKISDSSRVEIISHLTISAIEDSYAASTVFLKNSEPDNAFSIDEFTAARDNRFTVTQTQEDDDRYRLVIQGEEYTFLPENDIPETGDGANLALWIGLCGLSLLALVCLRRKEYGR